MFLPVTVLLVASTALAGVTHDPHDTRFIRGVLVRGAGTGRANGWYSLHSAAYVKGNDASASSDFGIVAAHEPIRARDANGKTHTFVGRRGWSLRHTSDTSDAAPQILYALPSGPLDGGSLMPPSTASAGAGKSRSRSSLTRQAAGTGPGAGAGADTRWKAVHGAGPAPGITHLPPVHPCDVALAALAACARRRCKRERAADIDACKAKWWSPGSQPPGLPHVGKQQLESSPTSSSSSLLECGHAKIFARVPPARWCRCQRCSVHNGRAIIFQPAARPAATKMLARPEHKKAVAQAMATVCGNNVSSCRRRVPRLFDLSLPLMNGVAQGLTNEQWTREPRFWGSVATAAVPWDSNKYASDASGPCARLVRTPTFVLSIKWLHNVWHLLEDLLLPVFNTLLRLHGEAGLDMDVSLWIRHEAAERDNSLGSLRADVARAVEADRPLRLLRHLTSGRVRIKSREALDFASSSAALEGSASASTSGSGSGAMRMLCFEDLHFGLDQSDTTMHAAHAAMRAHVDHRPVLLHDARFADVLGRLRAQQLRFNRHLVATTLGLYEHADPGAAATAAGVDDAGGGSPGVVLFVERRPPQHRVVSNHLDLLREARATVAAHYDPQKPRPCGQKMKMGTLPMSVESVAMEKLTLSEQVLLLRRTRVLAVVHGQAATNLVFLPRPAALVLMMEPGNFGCRWVYADMALASSLHIVALRSVGVTSGSEGCGGFELHGDFPNDVESFAVDAQLLKTAVATAMDLVDVDVSRKHCCAAGSTATQPVTNDMISCGPESQPPPGIYREVVSSADITSSGRRSGDGHDEL